MGYGRLPRIKLYSLAHCVRMQPPVFICIADGCARLHSMHELFTLAHREAKIVNATLFQAQSKALEILGIVCSALSVICLAMTLLVLNVLKYGIVSF
jgi:hypothetical protein